MDSIKIEHHGNFNKSFGFLKSLLNLGIYSKLDYYGEKGVEALERATPKDSGITAKSWYYEISDNRHGFTIEWRNSNATRDSVPIVLMLQHGHATKGGGFKEGYDFINPALEPLIKEIQDELNKEVKG